MSRIEAALANCKECERKYPDNRFGRRLSPVQGKCHDASDLSAQEPRSCNQDRPAEHFGITKRFWQRAMPYGRLSEMQVASRGHALVR